MALSGDAQLERAAAAGLHTLGAAPGAERTDREVRGSARDEPISGISDASIRPLVADRARAPRSTPRGSTLRRRYARRIQLAMQWLLAQEHQRFFLLQQNEASDWADIMPRSGFVLYTNALWYSRQTPLRHRARARNARRFQRPLPSFLRGASPSTAAPGCSTIMCCAAAAIGTCT